MLDRVPLEIALHIISLVPLTTFKTLYQVLPETIVDEALRIHLSSSSRHDNNKKNSEPLLNLVSTNLCELSAPRPNASCWLKNESWVPLYFAKMDIPSRILWLFPGFASEQHYFRVEDSYVSHGKLLLRPTAEQLSYNYHHGQRQSSSSRGGKEVAGAREGGGGRTTLASLWDIRKQLPPTRAGTFSGASEFATQSQSSREMTIEQMGCWVDACLLCPSTNDNTIAAETTATFTTTFTTNDNDNDNDNAAAAAALDPPRPVLPKEYARRVPARERDPMSMSSRACGYFLVERVGLSIPSLLDMFFHDDPQL
ncbi:hypothetical protein BDB00DRAFT_820647 [Zychaea mexicana]|uniref:uncharacterized protein n=1 Tax=Zychaea mexicana TaxID=64656 RepID=UPI0022FF061E|nr:uncharacterized protein BDB00DRAFT_820647 [Zychaea mexicana]KAI9494042.1 hypothetical protein BDB00DRAFT_820647 [Zychaea mexicana]